MSLNFLKRFSGTGFIIMQLFLILSITSCEVDDTKETATADTTPPVVVSLSPATGATNVNASTATKIIVTFNEPMGSGNSFANPAGEFPAVYGTPSWTSSTVIEFPVTLVAGKHYTIGLNSATYDNFRDLAGNKLVPVTWTFTTAP